MEFVTKIKTHTTIKSPYKLPYMPVKVLDNALKKSKIKNGKTDLHL